MTVVDLNGFLAAIVDCDAKLRDAKQMADLANIDLEVALKNLVDAQRAFDDAVFSARGVRAVSPIAALPDPAPAPRPAVDAAPNGATKPDVTYLNKKIPMGPLPPTSPALHMLAGALDDTDDDREDQVFDADTNSTVK